MVTYFDQYAMLGPSCKRVADLHIGTGPDASADNKVIDSTHKVTHHLFRGLDLL
jgi:hypothetical protein